MNLMHRTMYTLLAILGLVAILFALTRCERREVPPPVGYGDHSLPHTDTNGWHYMLMPPYDNGPLLLIEGKYYSASDTNPIVVARVLQIEAEWQEAVKNNVVIGRDARAMTGLKNAALGTGDSVGISHGHGLFRLGHTYTNSTPEGTTSFGVGHPVISDKTGSSSTYVGQKPPK